MNNRFKRTLAILLVMVSIFGMLSSTALAIEATPPETAETEPQESTITPSAEEEQDILPLTNESTGPETVPETVPETAPEVTEEAAPDVTEGTIPETVPEATTETAAETQQDAEAVPETLPEVEKPDDDLTQEEIDALLNQVYQWAAIDGQIPAYLPESYIQEERAKLLGLEPLPNAEDDRDLKAYVTPTQVHSLVIPQTYYGLYWQNPSNGNRWQQWSGSWWVRKFVYFDLDNGQTGYCIEPFNDDAGIGSERVPMSWSDIHCHWSSAGGSFEFEKQKGISLVLAYGAPNNGDTSQSGKFATAALVWDMACGYRTQNGSLRFGASPFEKVLKNNQSEVYAKYLEILDALQDHGKVPSFAVKYASQIGPNQTYTLQYNSGSDKYEITLHDNNGVLEHFNYVSTISGLAFSKSGNDLTITATPDAAKQLTDGVVFRTRGHEVEVGPDACTVWKGASSSRRQLMVALNGDIDPTPSCFKLRIEEPKGQIHIKKVTNVGTWLSGWEFNVYDSNKNFVETIVTDENGDGYSSMLKAGRYTVNEKQKGSQWDCDTSDHVIQVTSGHTHLEEWHNVLMGQLEVQKTAVNGSAEGWNFEILKDGQLIEKLTTGADGKARSKYLHPGKYTVREIHDRDDTYWEYDANVEKDAVVNPGANNPTIVPFTNTQYGRIEIKKTMATDGPLDGWVFKITDASGTEISGSPFTTDASGTIITGKLKPGQYTVEELLPENFPYYCKSENPQTITVVAGQTGVVTYTNALRPGKITIHKNDPTGNPLAGAKFLLEWSKDGKEWLPVQYSDAEDVVLGGCSNPDLADGCLVSGEDGIVEFGNLYPTIMYRLTEMEAPQGYQLLSEPVYVGNLQPEKNFEAAFTVINNYIYTLPATGSSTMRHMVEMGAVLCGIAAISFGAMITKTKKKGIRK